METIIVIVNDSKAVIWYLKRWEMKKVTRSWFFWLLLLNEAYAICILFGHRMIFYEWTLNRSKCVCNMNIARNSSK